MKVFTMLLLAALCVLAGAVKAEPIKISTGGETGAYYTSVGPNLAKAMGGFKDFKGVNLPQVITSQGSLENLDRVANNEAQLAIVQPDAFMYWRKLNPNLSNNIELIAELPVQECVFMVVKKDAGIDGLEDLKEGDRVGVGKENSGTYASWNFIAKLVKGLDKVGQETGDPILLLGAVQTGGSKALITSGFKDRVTEIQEMVNAEDSGLEFVSLDQSNLKESLPNGKPVYVLEKSVVNSAGWDAEVKVPCFKPLVVGNVSNPDGVNATAGRAIFRNGVNIVQLRD